VKGFLLSKPELPCLGRFTKLLVAGEVREVKSGRQVKEGEKESEDYEKRRAGVGRPDNWG